METELVPIERGEMARSEPTLESEERSIVTLIGQCIERGQDPAAIVATYQKLVDLRAKREFNRAFAAFKRECPKIPRRSMGVGGGGARYAYAGLEDIQDAIDPVLSRCGLSYSFVPTSTETHSVATLILRHVDGHAESFGPFSVPTDTKAGMQPQQKIGSAESYAKRYALVAALSLRVGDLDPDGNDKPGEVVSQDQAWTIEEAIRNTEANKNKFLAWVGVKAISDIPAARFDEVMEKIRVTAEARRSQ